MKTNSWKIKINYVPFETDDVRENSYRLPGVKL